ncbi:MAG TPA: F0F1 ATP synthase subunit A, partial [Spirochaetota bacterium]|nr:F0F1 ATP synthase subunit A [Spirochaetota bacterium]
MTPGEAVHIHSPVSFLNGHELMIITMMILDYIIVFMILSMGTSSMKLKPGKSQNLVEWSVTYICNYADDLIGKKEARRFYPLFVMLFFYIFVG